MLRHFDSKGANLDSSPCQAQRQLAAVGAAVVVEEPESVIVGRVECPCGFKRFLQTSGSACMPALSAGVHNILNGHSCTMLCCSRACPVIDADSCYVLLCRSKYSGQSSAARNS